MGLWLSGCLLEISSSYSSRCDSLTHYALALQTNKALFLIRSLSGRKLELSCLKSLSYNNNTQNPHNNQVTKNKNSTTSVLFFEALASMHTETTLVPLHLRHCHLVFCAQFVVVIYRYFLLERTWPNGGSFLAVSKENNEER